MSSDELHVYVYPGVIDTIPKDMNYTQSQSVIIEAFNKSAPRPIFQCDSQLDTGILYVTELGVNCDIII